MEVETTRFGTLEVSEDRVIEFSQGLFGFEDVDRYVLFGHREGSPFRWLQAIDRPGLAFVVMEPFVFSPDYRFTLLHGDREALGCSPTTRLEVFVVVGIPEDPVEMTANLKGPILINFESGRGRQVLLEDEEYSPRFRIVDAIMRRRRCPRP